MTALPATETETCEFKKSLADLRRGNVSRRRNPLIADLLRRIHLVEAWGRGMPLILKNAPNVEFREVAGLFIAGFQRPTALETTPETNIETSMEADRKAPRNARETLIQYLREQPRASIPELMQATGLSTSGQAPSRPTQARRQSPPPRPHQRRTLGSH